MANTEYTIKNNPAIQQRVRWALDGTCIVDRPSRGSMLQWSDFLLTAASCVLGQTTKHVVELTNSDQLSRTMLDLFFKCTVRNNDDTNSVTLPRGIWDIYEKYVLYLDESKAYEIDHLGLKEMYANWLFAQGEDIYTNSYFVRGEDTTNNGITIAPETTKDFYLPMNFLVYLKNKTIQSPQAGHWNYGDIKKVTIDTTARPAATSVATASRICKGSADVNMWTDSKISITNMGFIYSYVVNTQPTDVIPLFKDLSGANRPFVQLVPVINEVVAYTGTIAAGQKLVTKTLSEIEKVSGIQKYNVFLRKVPTAYNDAACCKRYSGYRYLNYKMKQKSAPNLVQDLTDTRKLKQFEIDQYKMEYGQDKRLPIEFYNTDSDFSNTFLPRTQLLCDYYRMTSNYETVSHFNTNNSVDDNEAEIYATQTLSGNYELVIQQVRYKEYVIAYDTNENKYKYNEQLI
jgi:hypothetical protein